MKYLIMGLLLLVLTACSDERAVEFAPFEMEKAVEKCADLEGLKKVSRETYTWTGTQEYEATCNSGWIISYTYYQGIEGMVWSDEDTARIRID